MQGISSVDFACMPDELTVDPEIHQRAEIREDIVDDLVAVIDEAGSDGWPFATRVQVCRIGNVLYVTDGAHRVQACRLRDLKVNVSMRTCQSREEAVLDGVRANGTHGAKRSAADTRKAVHSAARQWPDWSNQVIANHMCVTAEIVRRYRAEITDGSQPAQRRDVNGVLRSATKKSRKKKEPAVEPALVQESSPQQEVVDDVPEPLVIEPEVRHEEEVLSAVTLSVETRYERNWDTIVSGLSKSEIDSLKAWVAEFHGFIVPPKSNTLFPEDVPVPVVKRRRKPTDDEFERFWAAYPRKTNKLKALTAMEKAFKLLTATKEPDDVMEMLVRAASLYAERCSPDPKFQMHPSSWLNAGRWSDSADSIGKKREQEAWAHGMFVE